MQLDLELYRKEIFVSVQPEVRLSVIDISPDAPEHTLVFLHGYGGQATQWRYQLEHFSQSNRVIAIDLRGHGRSSKPPSSYTMAQVQSDLQAVLDRSGVAGRFTLVGHSFGGAVATEYASAHPERVERLVLIAAAGEFQLNPFFRTALHLPISILQLAVPLMPRVYAPPHVLKAWYHNNLSHWNGWSMFRSLTVPTLIIRGHRDLVLARPLFEEVARLIPDNEEIDLGYSGHMVMLERRDAVNRAMERFLDKKPHSWRDQDADRAISSRAALHRSRPWLAHYESDVPYTVAVPPVPLYSLLGSAARRFPRRTAIYYEGSRLSYQRLNQLSWRFAHALRTLGLQPGERVLILLPNLPQFVIAFFGVLRSGAVAVFTLPDTNREHLVQQVHETEARLIITLDSQRELAQSVMQEAQSSLALNDRSTEAGLSRPYQVILVDPYEYLPMVKKLLLLHRNRSSSSQAAGYLAPEEYRFTSLLETGLDTPLEPRANPDDLAVIQYTGGTTAEPKGVMLSHRNLVANAIQTRSWTSIAKDGQERFLCVLPFTHIYGLTTALNVPIAMGATLIIKPRFVPLDILKTIQRQRPTLFPGVPQMYVTLSDFPSVRRYGISSIKACISGSAPLPVEVQEAFERLTRGRLVEGYGLTEASPVTHANPLNELRKIGSIGIPLPSTEARIVDLQRGKDEVPTGQIGELAVRGPQVMLGYWQNPAATRQSTTPDGWLLTGDVAQADEEGYFRLVARKADMWYPDRPGQPAFPRDVEEVLYEVPQVKEAAVVAVASQPIAFVIARAERPTSEALIAYARRRLPPELVPRWIIFVDDFPRTFIGKVIRRELARHFESTRNAS